MNNPVLTERDLEAIFSGKKKPKTKTPLFRSILFVGSFLIISGIVYLIINLPSLNQNLRYWYSNEYKITPINTEAQILAAVVVNEDTSTIPEIADNSLNFPAINVKAPVTWSVPNTPTEVATGLSKGLIQIKGTALPGETGNVFITGHSSNYPWAKGNYNTIFAILNKAVVGDMIQVKYQSVTYIYKVKDIKVVEATDTSVLTSKKESVLTLMTCSPVGTSLRRLIVVADQVYPDPKTNRSMQSQGTASTLPNVR